MDIRPTPTSTPKLKIKPIRNHRQCDRYPDILYDAKQEYDASHVNLPLNRKRKD